MLQSYCLLTIRKKSMKITSKYTAMNNSQNVTLLDIK